MSRYREDFDSTDMATHRDEARAEAVAALGYDGRWRVEWVRQYRRQNPGADSHEIQCALDEALAEIRLSLTVDAQRKGE